MQLNVKNETSTLKAVVLGQPGSIGKVPTLEETYDAKSYSPYCITYTPMKKIFSKR